MVCLDNPVCTCMISRERNAQINFKNYFEHFSSTFVGLRGDPGPDGASGNRPEGLPGIRGPPGQIGNIHCIIG